MATLESTTRDKRDRYKLVIFVELAQNRVTEGALLVDERQQSSHDSRDMVDGRLLANKDRSMKSTELDQTLTDTVHKNGVGLDQRKQLKVHVRSKLEVSLLLHE